MSPCLFFDQLPDKNLICAHRGVRTMAPENTMLALAMARKCGAHCLETDVQLAKDGELIIFHDDTLERTTDISGHTKWRKYRPWPVNQFDLQELRKLNAGSWFLKTDPFDTVASGAVCKNTLTEIRQQKIPPLRELLTWAAAHRFPVNLEIKELSTRPEDTKLVEKVLNMLQETGTMELSLLSSFHHDYLLQAKALCADVSLAVLADTEHPEDLINYLKHFSAAAYHPQESLCQPELITRLRQAGIMVNCWTVNNMERAQELHRAGAGVITDWPQLLAKDSKTP